MLQSRHRNMSHFSVFKNLCGPFLNTENVVLNGEQENESINHDGIEKSVHRNHCLLSPCKPHDAKGLSSRRIFLSHPHTHDRFLYCLLIHFII